METITTTTTTTTQDVLPPRRALPIAVGVIGTAALWLGGVALHHGSVQDTLRDRSRGALAQNGLSGVDASFKGRDATLTGVVPTEADIAGAHDLVRERTGVRHVTDRLTVAAGAATTTGITSTLDGGRIVLEGVVPTDAAKTALGQAAADVVGAANVDNRLTVVAGVADPQAALATLLAGLAKNGISGGTAQWRTGRLMLTGTVPTEAVKSKAAIDASALVGGAANVVNQLQVATPTAATSVATTAPATTTTPATTAPATAPATATPATSAAPVATTAAPSATTAAPAADVADTLANAVVYFGSDSAAIGPQAEATIDAVADVMQSNPAVHVSVNGNTDVNGSDEYNLALSQLRADGVRDALIQRGIDPGRITTSYVGKTRPAADDDALNRRVEFSLER